jgi:hypothetical protein
MFRLVRTDMAVKRLSVMVYFEIGAPSGVNFGGYHVGFGNANEDIA